MYEATSTSPSVEPAVFWAHIDPRNGGRRKAVPAKIGWLPT
jgi:hypothetical protein